MGYRVRALQESDLDWLCEQLRQFADFFGTTASIYPGDAYTRTAALALSSQHLFLVCDRDDVGPVGFIVGILTPHYLNPNIVSLAEILWWVAEEWRQTRAGVLLLNAFTEFGKRYAAEHNLGGRFWMTLSKIEHKSPLNEDHLLARGWHLHERSYLMEVH